MDRGSVLVSHARSYEESFWWENGSDLVNLERRYKLSRVKMVLQGYGMALDEGG